MKKTPLPWRGIPAQDLLALTVVTLAAVVTSTLVYVHHLTRLALEGSVSQAEVFALEVYGVSRDAIARRAGVDPAAALAEDPGLRSLLDAHTGSSDQVVYALLVGRDGRVLLASEGAPEDLAASDPRPLGQLLEAGPLARVRALWTGPPLYEERLPLDLDGEPFGVIRLGVATGLVRRELGLALAQSGKVALVAFPLAWVVALLVARLTLRPLRRLRRQIGRLRRGELELEEEAFWDLDLQAMASDLRQLGQEVQSQRLELLGQKVTLEHLVQHLQDGVLFLDRGGKILFFNRACDELLGGDQEKLAGRPLADTLGAEHPLVRLIVEADEREESIVNAPLELPSPGGRFGEALVSVFLVPPSGGHRGGFAVLVEDLETIRTLRSLVRYSTRMLALGRITAEAVHEIKNPLHAMRLHVEVLKETLDQPSAAAQKSLEVLGREITDLDRLLQDFLEYARPQELRPERRDLNALLRRVAHLVEPSAREARVEIALRLPGEPVDVLGDEEQLRQAFVNLARNGIEAMPEGGTLTFTTSAAHPAFAEAVISDTGVGIELDRLPKVFHLYYTTKENGSGIGLAVVHRIIHHHGGTVQVRSEVGEGTEIRIRLPRAGAEEAGPEGELAEAGRVSLDLR